MSQGTAAAGKQRRVPVRQCLGCGAHRPKAELLRIVRAPDGRAETDPTGRKSGRGAYICRDVKCLRRARKSGRLARSLSCEIPPEVYDRLEREMAPDAGAAPEASGADGVPE